MKRLACFSVLRTWSPSLNFQLWTVFGQFSWRKKGSLTQRSIAIAESLEAEKGKGAYWTV